MDNRSLEALAAASAPSAPGSPSSGYPTNGNPGTGTPATILGEYWFYQIGEELRNVITAANITPDAATLTQLLSAIKVLRANAVLVNKTSSTSIGDSGTAGTITIPFSAIVFDEIGSSVWTAGSPTRLTVPSGYSKAKISANLNWDPDANGFRNLTIEKNGAGGGFAGQPYESVPGSSISGANAVGVATAWIAVSSGDYFELRFSQNSGSTINAGTTSDLSWFQMELRV